MIQNRSKITRLQPAISLRKPGNRKISKITKAVMRGFALDEPDTQRSYDLATWNPHSLNWNPPYSSQKCAEMAKGSPHGRPIVPSFVFIGHNNIPNLLGFISKQPVSRTKLC